MPADFSLLWANFPRGARYNALKQRCFNRQADSSVPFSDYCAIALSECFLRSGFSLTGLSGSKCWSHDGTKHLLLAEQLAGGINRIANLAGPRINVRPASWQREIDGRTGIVFFKDYWRRGNESEANRSGDHIDLWNGSRITGYGRWERWIYEVVGAVSDLDASRAIWFWPVER